MAFGNLGSIWAEIGLNTAKLQAGVTTAKLQLSTLDKQALTQAASINAKLQTIGTGLQSVGRNMSMYVTLPLMAVGAASIKAGADFDSGMTKSLAIMTNITPQIRAEMEKTAKSIVDYTTFSAKEGADAYFYLASAGLDAAQSIEALPRVAKFAQAGQFDLALATDLLTDAQSALGLTIRDDVTKNMENMVRVSDVLVKANTLSNATVQQFSESLTNKAGAALKLLNKDIEEGVAVLAAWADQGVKGAEAGNWLNIVLRDLQRSAIENGEVFEQFNIDVFDTSGNVRNMADVIGDLETALEGMSDKEKRATLMMLGFQDRSISAMMTLLGTSDAIRGYEEDLRSATGFTEDVAAKQMESFTASVEQLKNQLINVGISLFDILKPRLESVVEIVKKGIDWFNNLSDSQKKWLVNIGLFTAAIGPVLYGLGAMIRTVATLRTAFMALNIATKGYLANPITLIVAGILADITVLSLSIRNMVEDIKALNTVTEDYTQAVKNLDFAMAESAPAFEHTNEGVSAQWEILKKLGEKYPEITDEIVDLSNKLGEHKISFLEAREEVEKLYEKYHNMPTILAKYGSSMAKNTNLTTEQKIAIKDNEVVLENLMEQYGLGREEAIEYAEVQGLLADETDETTDSIDEQKQAIDDLRKAYNELIDEIFGLTNAENDLQKAEWDLIDVEKEIEAKQKELEKARSATTKSLVKNDEALNTFLSTNEEYINLTKEATELQNSLNEMIEKGEGNTTQYYQAQNKLKDTQDKINNIVKEGTKLTGEYVDTGKQSAAQSEKIAEIERELEQLYNDKDSILQDNLSTLFELYNQEGLDIDRKRELRQELVDLAKQAQETSGLSQEEFIAMANQFGISADEILFMCEELGYELTELEKERVIEVRAETASAESRLIALKNLLGQIQSKEVTVKTSYAYSTVRPYSAGGIVEYSRGGIVGNDGAKIPPLTAASGMVVPQTGRKVPIVAHEYEVIANTSQQKNVADWFWNFINNPPEIGRRGDIHIHLEYNEELASQNTIKLIDQKIGDLI